MTIDEFYNQYQKFRVFRSEAPYKIEILNAYTDRTDKNEGLILNFSKIGTNSSILDIGAGSKLSYRLLSEKGFRGVYKSMDVDTFFKHDFYSLETIKGNYDNVFMLEIIEHLELDVAFKYLDKAYEVLKKGGRLFLSTPNIDHINQLWRGNIGHIRQYPVRDLYGILKLMNFKGDIELYRIYLRPYKPNIKFTIKEMLKKLITRILDVDYAHGIMIIAEK